jgi:hexokinase
MAVLITLLDEGLKKDGTSLSQIPTYVTSVPNGTEKVGHCP